MKEKLEMKNINNEKESYGMRFPWWILIIALLIIAVHLYTMINPEKVFGIFANDMSSNPCVGHWVEIYTKGDDGIWRRTDRNTRPYNDKDSLLSTQYYLNFDGTASVVVSPEGIGNIPKKSIEVDAGYWKTNENNSKVTITFMNSTMPFSNVFRYKKKYNIPGYGTYEALVGPYGVFTRAHESKECNCEKGQWYLSNWTI